MGSSFDIEVFSRRGLRGRRHYFRCRAWNGEVLCQSEGYHNADDRDDTVQQLKAGFAEAQVVQVAR